jgi:hypothetical protein
MRGTEKIDITVYLSPKGMWPATFRFTFKNKSATFKIPSKYV